MRKFFFASFFLVLASSAQAQPSSVTLTTVPPARITQRNVLLAPPSVFVLENTTPSDGTNTAQYSPLLDFRGSSWSGSANRTIRIVQGLEGTTGSTAGRIRWQSSINGGAFSTMAILDTTGNWTYGGTSFCFLASSCIVAPSNGVLTLFNAASTDFTRLQFGGTSAAFPAIARNGAQFDFVFADGSGFALIRTGAIQASSSISTGISSSYTWGTSSNRSLMFSSADGNITFSNFAATSFSLLQLGGQTSSFPAIKKNGAAIDIRLADDSAFAPITASLVVGNTALVGPGANVASTGALRLANNTQVVARNNANSANVIALQVDASDRVSLGDTNNTLPTVVYGSVIPLAGTTSSFPALRRNGTAVEARLGDDSAYTRVNLASLGLGTTLSISSTAPSAPSSCGTSPTVTSANGTAAFVVTGGTGGAATGCTVTMPTAATGWNCSITNITQTAAHRADRATVQTASTTTSVTWEYVTVSTGAATAFTASDVFRGLCFAY